MTSSKITLAATGDSFITRGIPREEEGLKAVREFLLQSDIRFTNLEVTVHNFDVYPSASSGGTWAAARPRVLEDLQWLGFNTMSFANNHTLDWSHGGLLQTIEHMDRLGIVHAGAGRNLAEACQPRYIETPNGRVALIASNSTFEHWHAAGEQRKDLMGRPGLNPLRFKTVHRLRKDDFEGLKTIMDQTDINAPYLINKLEGFQGSEEAAAFSVGPYLFEIGEPGTITKMDEQDAMRIEQSIREAARQADFVVVSHHAHEMKGMAKELPADFLQEFAYRCIDAGANAYIGHGPHILRGIEIYRDTPIFYSLGDLFRESEFVEKQPTEFYDIYGLGPEHVPIDGFDQRNRTALNALAGNRKVYESVIALLEFEHGKISRLALQPVTLGFNMPRARRGRPRLASEPDRIRILRDLQELSESFGTKIHLDTSLVTIH
ncbi:CapA family protein [Paenibacillus sp. sgz302251]|uniref:CapA family protein n=1 Tax=Paenibacillus sp. sgz302251 TaxID=3414493 RepID=UPI003C7CC03C